MVLRRIALPDCVSIALQWVAICMSAPGVVPRNQNPLGHGRHDPAVTDRPVCESEIQGFWEWLALTLGLWFHHQTS